jgi:hypothetical protein
MIKKIVFIILLSTAAAAGGPDLVWIPVLQQTALYFSSDRVTMGGMGPGAGAQIIWRKNYLAQTDFSVLWANGNAFSTRLAAGYQKNGTWAPAMLAAFGLLWGQRTETLSETGQLPPAPVWFIGIRGAPLRFQGSFGYASALELGCGIGPDHGLNLEVTILSAGFNW